MWTFIPRIAVADRFTFSFSISYLRGFSKCVVVSRNRTSLRDVYRNLGAPAVFTLTTHWLFPKVREVFLWRSRDRMVGIEILLTTHSGFTKTLMEKHHHRHNLKIIENQGPPPSSKFLSQHFQRVREHGYPTIVLEAKLWWIYSERDKWTNDESKSTVLAHSSLPPLHADTDVADTGLGISLVSKSVPKKFWHKNPIEGDVLQQKQ